MNLFDYYEGMLNQGGTYLDALQPANSFPEAMPRQGFSGNPHVSPYAQPSPYREPPPQIPSLDEEKIKPQYKIGDVSGFASFGMQPPELPNPMNGMAGLMAMMGDPHANRNADPFPQQQPGGLMAYLQALARG